MGKRRTPYYENPQDYEKFNPVNFVARWRAPMLVIHGEQDFRVPYTQGLATFTALQRRGIESKLLIFPDENHWVLKPANSLQWHAAVLDWLDAHLKN
jgi:dipeptidyl aminopeptidase/acylaminoacyl peptidase